MSIIADASSYIKELKQKIAKLSQEMTSSSPQHATTGVCQQQPSSSSVSVGVLDKKGRFLVSVFMDESCGPPPAGLLASVLEAFDDIGLTVLEARATCAGSFRLEAVGEVRYATANEYTLLHRTAANAVVLRMHGLITSLSCFSNLSWFICCFVCCHSRK